MQIGICMVLEESYAQLCFKIVHVVNLYEFMCEVGVNLTGVVI
jgi:hypothetical protein